MNHTNTQKLLPITDCGGRIFTTTAVQAQKKNNAFSWAKNTARGVRFLLGWSMYLVWLDVNRYICFWHLPNPKPQSGAGTGTYGVAPVAAIAPRLLPLPHAGAVHYYSVFECRLWRLCVVTSWLTCPLSGHSALCPAGRPTTHYLYSSIHSCPAGQA